MTTATATKSPAEQFGIKPGTIFTCSWGYDQTNVDFYTVVSVSASGKSVKIRKCAASLVEGQGLIADPDKTPSWVDCGRCSNTVKQINGTWVHDYNGKPENWDGSHKAIPFQTKRIQSYGDKPFLNLTSYSNAYLWSGKPKFDTIALGYAGH